MGQLELPPEEERPRKGRGGKRKGAGRPPNGDKAGVSHLRRPEVDRRKPLHVTLKMVRAVGTLRRKRTFRVVREAIRATNERVAVGIVHFAVQDDHVHLIVESESKRALANGLRGLAVRLARGLNRELGRAGAVLKDRYHARALGTPREVKNAIAYVLNNFRKHRASLAHAFAANWLDPFSSAPWFDGWSTASLSPPDDTPRATVAPTTWLLTTGWHLHHGPLNPNTTPGPHP